MRRLHAAVAVLASGLTLAAVAPTAEAARLVVGVGVALPGAAVVAPAPLYVGPAPYLYGPRVYAPMYAVPVVGWRPHFWGGYYHPYIVRRGWR